jgi:predicted acetyltransferase
MTYEQKAKDFIKEFSDQSSETNGDGGLSRFLSGSTYSEWLDKIKNDMDLANIPEGRVPQFTYFYVREDDDKIVGMIAVRLALTDFLQKEGGHIGYCVRPSERGKGYATRMLSHALSFSNAIGLRDIVISCDKTNTASARVIQKCGGILDAEFYSDTFHEVIQRYQIKT